MGQPYSHRSYARITCPLRTTTIFETSFFRRWLMLQIHSDGTVKLMHGVLQRYRSVGAGRVDTSKVDPTLQLKLTLD